MFLKQLGSSGYSFHFIILWLYMKQRGSSQLSNRSNSYNKLMQSSKVKGCNQCHWYPVCSRLIDGLEVRHLVEKYQVGSSPRKTSEHITHHGKTTNLTSVHAPKTGAGGYGFCSIWRQYWFMCHWCKSNCLHQYNGTCSVPPQGQMYLLSVFLHDYREKNHSP